LIYRESQLRKAEAAAACKKTTSASTRHLTSTRNLKRTADNRDGTSTKAMKRIMPPKKIKKKSSKEIEMTRDKSDWKKYQNKCSSDGCTNQVQNGGVCRRHGAKVKRCSSVGCTKQAQKGGVCIRHGAHHNTQDESTAFGSEFEKTTVTQNLPNQRASTRAAIGGQEGRSVPGEVTIVCQEIVQV